MVEQLPRKCGRYRSVVRMLSSFLLPLRPAPRIFFNIVKNPCNVLDVKDAAQLLKDDNLKSSSQLLFQKCDLSPAQLSTKPDLLEFGTPSRNISETEDDIKENGVVTQKIDNLERELQHLREQMARIMAAQLQSEKRTSVVTPAPTTTSTVPHVPAPPPPPPPPPPPLPPMCNPSAPLLVIKRRQPESSNCLDTPKRPTGMRMPIDMSDVLKDMGKVKLRHIERSPGGTPLRQAPPATDPNTVLMQVLKRRYAAMHDKTPEKLHRCMESDSSFGEENFSPTIKC